MSIGLATMGMFNNCCGTQVVSGGGGAPPYRPYSEEKIVPTVLVKKFTMQTIKPNDKLYKKITAKLLEDNI